MSIALTQLRLNCPGCGNNLWRAVRSAYNMDTKAWEERETTAYCEKCEVVKHIELLKHADKIVMLTKEKKEA